MAHPGKMDEEAYTPEESRKRRRIWLAGLTALAVLALLCLWWAAARVPADLASRASRALRLGGLEGRAAVQVEGRLLTLEGQARDAYERARMLAIAAAVPGVREVVDRLAVAPKMPPSSALAQSAPLPGPEPASRTTAAGPSAREEDPAPADAGAVPGAPAPREGLMAQTTLAAPERPAAPPASTATNPPGADAPERDLPVLRFGFNSDRLPPEGEARLEAVVKILLTHPDLRLELGGHTDATGDRSYNRRLSLRRAEAVARRLAASGIEPGRLQPLGYGDTCPQADNRSRQGRVLNRRVELRII